ncbi:MAG: PEP-CTERM sorting domain-containing protein, partial [Bryobacteraceae bacterium]
LTVLASIWNGGIQVDDFGATGWHAFTYVLPAPGSYRLGFGVVNTEDEEVWSHLFLDGAPGTLTPEPSTFALLGAGLLGLSLLRRR